MLLSLMDAATTYPPGDTSI